MSIKYDGFSDIGGVDYNEGAPVAGGVKGSIQFNDGMGNFAGHPMANVVVEYDSNTGEEYANIHATNLALTGSIGGNISTSDPVYGVIYSDSQTATTSEILFINPETSTMTLYGNMVVTGDVNTLGANNLIVSDNIIEVGSNASDSTNVGIVYQRPAGNVMTGYVTGGQYDNTFVIAHTDNSAFSYELHPNTESNIHMSVVGNVGIQNSNPLHYLSLGENGAQGTQYFEGNVIITSTGTTVRIGKEQDVAVNPSDFTVAIGCGAGVTNQHENTVIINATGVDLDSDRSDAIFMAPMRYLPLETTSNVVTYNPTTGEVTQSELISNSFDLQNTCERGNTYGNTITVGNLVAQNNVEAIQFLGNGAHLVSTTNVQDGNYGDTDNVVAITITDGRITALTNVASNIEDLQNTSEQGNTYDSAIILTSTDENLVLSGMIKSASEEVAYGSGFSKASVAPRGIRLGHVSADTSQGSYSIAMGYQAGQTDQGEQAVAIGWGCGGTTQGSRGIAIGRNSGNNTQGIEAIALGFRTGRLTQGVQGIAVGTDAGENTQGDLAIAVGVSAGRTSQGGRSVAIGPTAGSTSQGDNAIAVGFRAGQTGQGEHAVAVGTDAGKTNQADNSIVVNATGSTLENTTASSLVVKPVRYDADHQNALSYNATTGEITHSENVSAVHFFGNASHLVSTTNVADDTYGGVGNVAAITILDGRITALTNVAVPAELQDLQNTCEQGNTYDSAIQLTSSGNNLVLSGMVYSSSEKVAFGSGFSVGNVGTMGVRLGSTNVNTAQGDNSVAIGYQAGESNQGGGSVSIGWASATNGQGSDSVAVGRLSGGADQGPGCVAVGFQSAIISQNAGAVAIGQSAGWFSQGSDAVALGNNAGRTSQADNSIVINATGSAVDNTTAASLVVKPVRFDSAHQNAMSYNATTGEITHSENVSAVNFFGNASHLVSTTNVADDTYGGLGNVAAITILDGRISSIVNVQATTELQNLHNVVEQGNITTLTAEFMNTENAIKTNLISNVIIDPSQLNNVVIDYDTIEEKHTLVWDGDNWVNHFPEEIVTDTEADVAISKGQAVYVSDGAGATPKISPADPTDPAKMPSIGVALENGGVGDHIHVCTKGVINVALTGMTVGNTVYVSNTTPGDLMDYRPSADTDLVQNIGIVIKEGNGGKLLVTGVGRTNDVPNTTTNSMKDLDITGIYVQDTGNVITKIGFESLAQMVTTKVEASVAVARGELVYVDGVNAGMPTVSLAQSDSAATCPYAGFMCEALNPGEVGRMATHGVIITDTGAFSDGAQMWLSNTVAGGMMTTPPDYVDSDLIQSVGFVIDAATEGRLLLINPGRVTAVPNTTLQLPGAITANGVYVEDLATGDFTRVPVSDLAQDLQNVCETGNVYNSAITVTNVLTTNVVSTNVSGNGSGLTSTTDVADDTYGGLGNVAAITILDGRVTQIQNVEAPMLLQDLQNVGEQGNTYDSTVILTSTGNNLVLSGMVYSASEDVGFGSGFSKASVGGRGIRVGHTEVDTAQGQYSIAMGYQAGETGQGEQSVAMGWASGLSNQGSQTVAIGRNCGSSDQEERAIAVGLLAGQDRQRNKAVAIGANAGQSDQGSNSVALGADAAKTSQGSRAVAVGSGAAAHTQNAMAVAIGFLAAQSGQGTRAVAIGVNAARTHQNAHAIALGDGAGQNSQGSYAVALGVNAGRTSQADNSIVINATSSDLNNTTDSSLVVKPVRYDATHQNTLSYNATTGEITHSENVSAANYFGNASTLTSLTGAATGTWGGTGNAASVVVGADGYVNSISNVPATFSAVGTDTEIAFFDAEGNITSSGDYYYDTSLGNVYLTGNLTIDGNLVVDGDITKVDTTTLSVVNPIAEFNNDGADVTAGIILNRTDGGNTMMGYLSTESGGIYDEKMVFARTLSGADDTTLTPLVSNKLEVVVVGNLTADYVTTNAAFMVSTTNVADDTYGGVGNVCAVTIADGRITALTNVAVPAALQDLQNVGETGNVYDLQITVGNVATDNVVSINVSGNGSGLTSTTDVADDTYGGGLNVAAITILNGRVTQIQNTQGHLQDLQNVCEHGNTYTLEATFGNVATTNVVTTNVSGNGSGLTSTTDVADDTYGGGLNVAAITITNGRVTDISNTQGHLQDLQNVCEQGNVYTLEATFGNIAATNVVTTNISGNGSHLTSLVEAAPTTYGAYDAVAATANIAQITVSTDGRITSIANVEISTTGPTINDFQTVGDLGNTYNSTLQLTTNPVGIKMTGGILMDNPTGATIIGGADIDFSSAPTDAIIIGPRPDVGGVSYAAPGDYTVSIGPNAGFRGQSNYALAIGNQAGRSNQGASTVAIGSGAARNDQGEGSVAIGLQAGQVGQKSDSIAIGFQAAKTSQGVRSIALGRNAGQSTQGEDSIAFGYLAGTSTQGSQALAVGTGAGKVEQGDSSVALGYQAGQISQSVNCLAIGVNSGRVEQGSGGFAVGTNAGENSQGERAFAMGFHAGKTAQGELAMAIGYQAAQASQGSRSIAIGANCQRVCNIGLQPDRVAIGFQAGESNQASRGVAIGYRAGHSAMGANSIVVGAQAGGTSMGENSTFLSAAGDSRQFQINSGFGVTPVRSTAVGGTQGNIMHYDPTTFEISYDTAKTFVIPHPNRPGRMLVHGCLEGPEGGVYYRGKGNSSKPVRLPDYVPDLIMDEPTIHVTPIGNNQSLGVSEWNRSNNTFRVIADRPTDFHWTFTAMRVPVDVEPFESEVEVKGQGPYTYI